MNITLDLIFFIFIFSIGLYVVYKIEHDVKILRILKAYPVAAKVKGEGLIDFSNLSVLIRDYDIEYSVDGPVDVERVGEGVYRIRAKSGGRVTFRIVAYGNFDEYSVEKTVEVLGG
ncbi:hypothetical protein B7L68_04190 [Thermoproteus sp. CP80]|jgi:hypothetical protein|nr:MAG: hypothetical protein AT711_02840 [Thermoproteus sp. CIS_19]KUO86863.1 MAG: hypothetical protein AT715_00455 [Thermoproteus sp. JCHS_4]PLC64887.1 hypothetical protein B7L68_04190 [Thermoproteus sp. CP80]